jgi:exonuclease III
MKVTIWMQEIQLQDGQLARLIVRNENYFHVHYEGWSSGYDEWISLGSKRLAPY